MPDVERKSVSASQIAALFDTSPYLTRWMLWHYLAGTPQPADDADERMKMGTRMEPLLLELASEDLRIEVTRDQHYVRNGVIGCTRDARIHDPQRGPGCLETKCCFDYRQWMNRWSGGKAPPIDLELQLQAQMLVGDGTTPFNWGVLMCWVGGERKYFEREPKLDLWEEMKASATALLASVAAGVEPDPFGSVIELPLLKQLFPRVERVTLDLSAEPTAQELAESAAQLNWAREQHSFFGKLTDQIKAQLIACAKDNDTIALPEGVFVEIKKTPTKASVINRKAGVTTYVTVYRREAPPQETVLGPMDAA